jgi:hypothetical protein
MIRFKSTVFLYVLAVAAVRAQSIGQEEFARDSKQPIDQSYTDRIRKYTTKWKLFMQEVVLPSSVFGYCAAR